MNDVLMNFMQGLKQIGKYILGALTSVILWKNRIGKEVELVFNQPEQDQLEPELHVARSLVDMQFSELWERPGLMATVSLCFFALGFVLALYAIMKQRSQKLANTIVEKERELDAMRESLREKEENLSTREAVFRGRLENRMILIEGYCKAMKSLKEALSDSNTIDEETREELMSYIYQCDNFDSMLSQLDHENYQVNKELFTQLLAVNPALSRKELKLIVYVRLNLSNRQIANLTNRSTDSVKAALSRLRKKLGLAESGQTLAAYINQFDR